MGTEWPCTLRVVGGARLTEAWLCLQGMVLFPGPSLLFVPRRYGQDKLEFLEAFLLTGQMSSIIIRCFRGQGPPPTGEKPRLGALAAPSLCSQRG